MRIFVAILIALMTTSTQVLAEGWPTWSGPPGGSKYSSLKQINRDNFYPQKVSDYLMAFVLPKK